MTRPILRPVLNNVGQLTHYDIIGYDYKAERANRPTSRRFRRLTAGTSPRRRFRTVAMRP